MLCSCSIKDIGDKLLAEDNYFIIGHVIPDGDCVGSMLALYQGLKSLGKKAEMILADGVPELYLFLDNAHLIKSSALPEAGDYSLIFLDCSDKKRAGDVIGQNFVRPKYTFNIDHHATNDFFADYNYVDSSASSTAEIIYNILEYMQVNIDSSIAEALYTGMLMDTGSFQYSNTKSSTLQKAAYLLDKGVELDKLRINLFESKPKEEILLLARALQSIEFSPDGKIAWMTLPYADVESIGALHLHPEGIINYTRMIKGVEVGILFREVNPGIVKIGFRSKGRVDVAALASEIGGGGHKKAAGASKEGDLQEIKRQVLAMVKEVVK